MVRQTRTSIATSCVLLAALLAAFPASAAQRTFVSGAGSDANTASGCSLSSPCRSFGAAIGQTIAGGEVVVLDSAGYGVVTITQSVSIVAPPGVYAGVTVASGDGITVNAGPGDKIVLRGLLVNGLPAATHGIVINSAGTVDIGRMEISGFSASAISFNGGSRLTVRESIVRDNAAQGIAFNPAAAAFLAIEASTFDRNNVGVAVAGGTASIRGSSVTENLAGGIVASGGAVAVVADTRVAKTPDPIAYGGIWSSGAGSSLQATRCEVSGYGIAYYADAGGQMQIVDSVATGYPNGAGVEAVGAGSTIDVERSSMNHFVIGFYSHGNATIRISASTATAVNTSMLAEFGGSIYSRQNNMSGSGTSGTITPLSPI